MFRRSDSTVGRVWELRKSDVMIGKRKRSSTACRVCAGGAWARSDEGDTFSTKLYSKGDSISHISVEVDDDLSKAVRDSTSVSTESGNDPLGLPPRRCGPYKDTVAK